MYDPIGPGTPAWNAADALIAARLANDKKAMHTARTRLKYHVKKNDGDYNEWKAFVQREVTEARRAA